MKEIDGGNSEEDAMKRRAVLEELTDILVSYLPHTTVELFGSSANGMDFYHSQLKHAKHYSRHRLIRHPLYSHLVRIIRGAKSNVKFNIVVNTVPSQAELSGVPI